MSAHATFAHTHTLRVTKTHIWLKRIPASMIPKRPANSTF